MNKLLKRGMSRETFSGGTKTPPPPKTVTRWANGLIASRTRVQNAKGKTVGNMIRNNQSAYTDDSGNKYNFAVRMLGANNKALVFDIGGETREVFPSKDLAEAKEIWLAIYELIKTDNDIQKQVATQLNANEYQGSASEINTQLNQGTG